MKKRFFSLLLALLTLLAAFSMTAMPVFADAPDGGDADGGSNVAASYKDLYVKEGLRSLLVAYQDDASVTLTDGAGTWENYVDGAPDAKIVAAFRDVSGASHTHTNKYSAAYTKTPFYTFHTVEYGEDGTPVAVRTNTLYAAIDSEGRPYVDSNTNGILIDGVLYAQVASVAEYREIVPTEEGGAKLYIKNLAVTYGGQSSMVVNGYDNSGNASSVTVPVPAYTTSGGDDTWTLITDEPTDGYTCLGNYQIGDLKTETTGGWTLSDGGITMSYSDYRVAGALMGMKISLGTLGELLDIEKYADSDYTLETVAHYKDVVDTDDFIFTGSRTRYEGESCFVTNTKIGSWSDYASVISTAFSGKPAVEYVYTCWLYGSRLAADSSNTAARLTGGTYTLSGAVSAPHNYAYTKEGQLFASHYDATQIKSHTMGEAAWLAGAVSGSSVPSEPSEWGFTYQDESGADKTGYLMTDREVYVAGGMPGTVYAIRVYDRTLSYAELLQNRFVDLCAYFDVDVSLFYEYGEAERESMLLRLGGLCANITFENGSAEALMDKIDDLTYDLAARQRTELYASMYAEGASAILMSYNAENKDGTVILSDGGGIWMNMVSGEYYNLLGCEKTYSSPYEEVELGWRLKDGALTYDQIYANTRSKKDLHAISLPTELMNEYGTTVEFVARANFPTYVGETHDFADVDESGTLSAGDTFYSIGNYVGLRHYAQCLTQNGVYLEGGKATLNFGNCFMTYAEGRWNHQNKGTVSQAKDNDLCPLRRLVVTDSMNKDGLIEYTGSFYSDGVNKVGSATATAELPAKSATSLIFVENQPADVYAIRIYNRVLTEAELLQNHFADLCAYYGLDVSAFLEYVPEARRTLIYQRFASYTFENADAASMQKALDEAVAVTFLAFDGFAIKVEGEGNELAAIYSTDEAMIQSYIDLGYGVSYGILMARKGDVDSLYDLVLDADGIRHELLWGSDGTGARKYLKQTDVSKTFGYSVFFDPVTNPKEYTVNYYFRAYVQLTTPEGETIVSYLSATTGNTGEEASLFEVANTLHSHVNAYLNNEKLGTLIEESFERVDLYVDTVKGNDNSENGPYKTIDAAIEAALKLISETEALSVTLHLPKGTTELSHPIEINGVDVRTDAYRLNIVGDADGSTALDGTVKVDGSQFTLYDAEKGIYKYELPASLKSTQFRALYVDGKSATLARGDWYDAKVNELGFVDPNTGETYWVVHVQPEALEGIVEYVDGQWQIVEGADTKMEWYCRMKWYLANIRVVDIDLSQSDKIVTGMNFTNPDNRVNKNVEGYIALRFHADDGDNYRKNHGSVGALERDATDFGGQYPFRLINNYAFLDEANEFYYDEEAGVIYYIPQAGKNMNDLTVGIPLVDELIVMEWINNVTIENLTFTGTGSNHMSNHGHMTGQAGSLKKTNVNREGGWNDDAAIVARNINGLTVRNCNFIELEYHGIYLAQSIRNVTVMGCNFDEIGASAIAAPTTVYYASVTNNYMHNTGNMYNSACTVFFQHAYELDVLFNSIINSAYTAVSVGWGWNWDRNEPEEQINIDFVEVAYNYFENYMCYMFDGGAVYFNGGAADISHDLLYNAIHDNYAFIGSREGHAVCTDSSTCWYMDGGSSHTYIYNNVVWVDEAALSRYCYISLQGSTQWKYDYENPAQQVYRVTAEDNYFINLYQDYLTSNNGSVKALFYLFEINSVLIVRDDLYDKAAELQDNYDRGIPTRHGLPMKEYMLIDPDTYTPVVEDMTGVLEVYRVIAGAGCEAASDRPLARADMVDLTDYYQKSVTQYHDEDRDTTMNDPRYDGADNVYDRDFFH